LLLRTAGIPARLVNGFKGGDWNGLVRVVNVREKHAHSWVEALVGRDQQRRPLWVALDGTPSAQQQQVVAQVGNVPPTFRTIFDALHYRWVFFVVGFDEERQERHIYGPLRAFAADVARAVRSGWETLQVIAARLFRFESPGEFFSLRGFLVSVGTMLAALGLGLGGRAAWHRWRRRRTGAGPGGRGAAEVVFFERLVRLLSGSGLERDDAETPAEFARRARSFLSARSDGVDGVAEVPADVVDAFYRVRFGRHELDDATAERLGQRLNALEDVLRTSTRLARG
jgi:hypothetical protein